MRQKSADLVEQIRANVRRYDFYQAVSILESLDEHSDQNGKADSSAYSAIRFRTSVGFSFNHAEIDRLEYSKKSRQPYELTVNFFGLTGDRGPLPDFYIQEILDQEAGYPGESAIRAFLDTFNHHLLQLKYDVRARMRPEFQLEGQTDDALRANLNALIGLALPEMLNSSQLSNGSLLRYAGLLHGPRRSLAGLEAMLSDYFEVNVECQALTGCWYEIDEEDLSRLGADPANCRLGETAVLGRRCWDQQGRFTVQLTVADWFEFSRFLPGDEKSEHTSLVELIAFYVNLECEYDLVIRLPSDQVPKSPLPQRLGWNSFLNRTFEQSEFVEAKLPTTAIGEGSQPKVDAPMPASA